MRAGNEALAQRLRTKRMYECHLDVRDESRRNCERTRCIVRQPRRRARRVHEPRVPFVRNERTRVCAVGAVVDSGARALVRAGCSARTSPKPSSQQEHSLVAAQFLVAMHA